ncbi:MAG: magnesium/cobalt efflux protein, partial [Plesiomonas sp.]
MSDDHSQHTDGPSKKGFFSQLLTQLFHGEPKNRSDLFDVIRDSEQNDLIDQETREMIEGVMEISELRVRDIMIP